MKIRLTPLDIACWGGMIAFAFSNMTTPICLPEISSALTTSLAEGGAMETARTLLLIVVLLLANHVSYRRRRRPRDGMAVQRFPADEKNEHSASRLIARILVLPGFWIFAVAVAFFAGMMAAGRFLAAKLSKTVSLKTIMMGSAVLGVLVSAVIPFADTLLSFYALLAVAAVAAACFWPTILAEAGNCLEVDSTMLFVLLSSVGIAGFGFTPWVMGWIGDRAHLRAGFFLSSRSIS